VTPEPARPETLGELVARAGRLASAELVLRLELDPADVSPDFPTLDAVMQAGVAETYMRMQDGPRLGSGAVVHVIAGLEPGQGTYLGAWRFHPRREGVAPGDIIYDYDAAALTHAFIARAERPFFYDLEALDPILPRGASVRWPDRQEGAVAPSDDSGLIVTPAARLA
jgi:hypothetical protein